MPHGNNHPRDPKTLGTRSISPAFEKRAFFELAGPLLDEREVRRLRSRLRAKRKLRRHNIAKLARDFDLQADTWLETGHIYVSGSAEFVAAVFALADVMAAEKNRASDVSRILDSFRPGLALMVRRLPSAGPHSRRYGLMGR